MPIYHLVKTGITGNQYSNASICIFTKTSHTTEICKPIPEVVPHIWCTSPRDSGALWPLYRGSTIKFTPTVAAWLSGNIVGHVNEDKVNLCRAELVLRWVTICGYTVLAFNQTTQANSAFHPSGVGKSSTGPLGWGKAGCVHLCRGAGNTVIPYGRWRHVALKCGH